eukprot:SAG11_NODE_8513_length_1007_cov_1.491189_2_plen_172_part_00
MCARARGRARSPTVGRSRQAQGLGLAITWSPLPWRCYNCGCCSLQHQQDLLMGYQHDCPTDVRPRKLALQLTPHAQLHNHNPQTQFAVYTSLRFASTFPLCVVALLCMFDWSGRTRHCRLCPRSALSPGVQLTGAARLTQARASRSQTFGGALTSRGGCPFVTIRYQSLRA